MRSGIHGAVAAIAVAATLVLMPLAAHAEEPPAESPPPVAPPEPVDPPAPVVILPAVPSTPAPPRVPTIPEGDFSLGPGDLVSPSPNPNPAPAANPDPSPMTPRAPFVIIDGIVLIRPTTPTSGGAHAVTSESTESLVASTTEGAVAGTHVKATSPAKKATLKTKKERSRG